MNNNISHKHIELLRYYISRDIKQIENKLKGDEYALLGYFLASIVDVFVVVIFEDWIKSLCWQWRIILILGLVLLYMVILILYNWLHKKYLKNQIIAGRDISDIEGIERMVDEFDNIAVDGLLLCIYYMEHYKKENDAHIKQLCLYETLHYLDKSCRVFRKISNDYTSFVNINNENLIATYRINNYLDIAEEVVKFLEERKGDGESEFEIKIKNLAADIFAWKKMELPM